MTAIPDAVPEPDLAGDASAYEWLEADGRGGFASGTVSGERTRRYHALLLPAVPAPETRWVVVAGLDAWLEGEGEPLRVFPQRYWPDLLAPERRCEVLGFTLAPWPTWQLRTPGGAKLTHELFIHPGSGWRVLRWQLLAGDNLRLHARPLLAGRDYHGDHHENGAFRFDGESRRDGQLLSWRPYPGVPAAHAFHDGRYAADPTWYRRFEYRAEAARGLGSTEDLASPGTFVWNLRPGQGAHLLWHWDEETAARTAGKDATEAAGYTAQLARAERGRRDQLRSTLARAAHAYLVQGRRGASVIAGYPWFADWGRDTFISLRGLCLANGRLDLARDILLGWSGQVSAGMLPNRFPESGSAPEYNTVDAALWYVVAAHEWMEAQQATVAGLDPDQARRLWAAIDAILSGYERGTRYGIRADADGLLAAGAPGVQLTWMDAKVGDWVVTPRAGKPVEVQALWINALTVGARSDRRWEALRDRARASFQKRFWNETRGCLYDVVDADGVPGRNDDRLRPNQLYALGGLPFPTIDDRSQARSVLDVVERTLLTPVGLRSLAPGEPGYMGRYGGDQVQRDGAYHQGTVWPYLLGPFIEGWVRVHGDTAEVRTDARTRFLAPWLAAGVRACGLGHLSEIADGDPPHAPRGCPFQAWSVGEALRVERLLGEGEIASVGTVAPIVSI